MSYFRVIPRDLFNEAKLLKCLGKLVIESETSRGRILVHHDGDPFQIEQDPNTGNLYVTNVTVWLDKKQIAVVTHYNSKSDWPLWADINEDFVRVFNNDGTLCADLIGEGWE